MSTSNANTGETLECPVSQIVIGTIVTLALVGLQENTSYGVIVLESKRVLIDFTTADSYERYVFSTVFKYTDVDQYDYVRLQLLRVEGEEWVICDELYLSEIAPGGIPLELTFFSAVVTIILLIFLIAYTGIRDYRQLGTIAHGY
jgi:hypothetical protein